MQKKRKNNLLAVVLVYRYGIRDFSGYEKENKKGKTPVMLNSLSHVFVDEGAHPRVGGRQSCWSLGPPAGASAATEKQKGGIKAVPHG